MERAHSLLCCCFAFRLFFYRFCCSVILTTIAWCCISLHSNIHCVSKKFPPLNCLWLCQILTDFQNFCTAGKRSKFAAKPIWQYPSHLGHVATLPWEIKNSNCLQIFSRYGTKCKHIAFWLHWWIGPTHLPWYLTDSTVGLRLVLLTQGYH